MRINRMASVPLLVHDPYYSIWSPADCLYDTDTAHWSGKEKRLYGHVTADGERFRFLGGEDDCPVIPQTSLEVTPTATTCTFENEKLRLSVRFLSPLLPEDPVLVSRPCTYIDFTVDRKQEVSVKVDFTVTGDLVFDTPGKIIGGSHENETYHFHYGTMRKAFQTPLGHSGDRITIDWGDMILASEDEAVTIIFDPEHSLLNASAELGTDQTACTVIAAYDDLLSIFYFGSWQKAYWTTRYETIFDAVGESFRDREEVTEKAEAFDWSLEEQARNTGGADYAFLCSISYRQVMAAHKLIADQEGNLVFLSKENDSNGCTGTVDISYPSAPMFLLFNPEYVKAMLRPVFRFAGCPVWEYDFAPHDVGRYPYAAGQVYGLGKEGENREFCYDNGAIFPFYYEYPAGLSVYDVRDQMPVEESGNMMILTAAVCELERSGSFAAPYYEVLKTWAGYLLAYGEDPGEQLCTDDFAGHLAHNVNLSAKAVMGIEAFSRIAACLGEEEEAKRYHEEAVRMAQNWETRSAAGDHYRLTFDCEESWSLKYNLVWDHFFGSGLFRPEVFETETAFYLKKISAFGVPLDSRKTYTKSDWILWCASFAPDREAFYRLTAPVAEYARSTEDRVPFSDWYDAESGRYCHFIGRSVQGGLYMPMLIEKRKKKQEA